MLLGRAKAPLDSKIFENMESFIVNVERCWIHAEDGKHTAQDRILPHT
jgi:hypothetical protein